MQATPTTPAITAYVVNAVKNAATTDNKPSTNRMIPHLCQNLLEAATHMTLGREGAQSRRKRLYKERAFLKRSCRESGPFQLPTPEC